MEADRLFGTTFGRYTAIFSHILHVKVVIKFSRLKERYINFYLLWGNYKFTLKNNRGIRNVQIF